MNHDNQKASAIPAPTKDAEKDAALEKLLMDLSGGEHFHEFRMPREAMKTWLKEAYALGRAAGMEEAAKNLGVIPDDILAKMLKPPVCGESEVSLDLGLSAQRMGGCGQVMQDPREWYRCGDCGVWFHQSCLKRHFGTEAAAIRAAKEEK